MHLQALELELAALKGQETVLMPSFAVGGDCEEDKQAHSSVHIAKRQSQTELTLSASCSVEDPATALISRTSSLPAMISTALGIETLALRSFL